MHVCSSCVCCYVNTVTSIVHLWTLTSLVCYCLSWPSQTGRRLGHLASTSIPLLGSSGLQWYTRREIYSTEILYLYVLRLKRTWTLHMKGRMSNKLIPEYKKVWLYIQRDISFKSCILLYCPVQAPIHEQGPTPQFSQFCGLWGPPCNRPLCKFLCGDSKVHSLI